MSLPFLFFLKTDGEKVIKCGDIHLSSKHLGDWGKGNPVFKKVTLFRHFCVLYAWLFKVQRWVKAAYRSGRGFDFISKQS